MAPFTELRGPTASPGPSEPRGYPRPQLRRSDWARALRTVLLMYDGLWQRPMPYVMVLHQAPTDGAVEVRL